MPYNSFFPTAYQQQLPQYVTPQVPPVQNSFNSHNNGLIWVQGEAGAKAYPVAPGNSVLLMDSETECFYIKSTDASGVPMPLRSFTYTEVVQTQPSHESKPDTSQFVTRQEFEELKKMLSERQTMQRKENRNEQTLSRNTKQQHDE